MKNYLSILLSVLLVGCTDFNGQENVISTGSVIPEQITALFEQPSVRTVVQEDRYIYWSEEDEISYFPQQNSNVQYRLHATEGETAYFTRISTPEASEVKLNCNYAVYPYAESAEVATEGHVSVQLPSLQSYAEESFGVGAATMVAVSDAANGATVKFANVVGFLKLQLYGSDAVVKRIEFRGNRGEKIAGAATVKATATSAPVVVMGDSATDVVTLDCGEGVRLSEDKTKPTAFWFALPPQLFEEGFTITIYDDKGTPYLKSTSKLYSIDRNMIQPMKALDMRGDTILDIEENDGKVLFYLAEHSKGVRSLEGMASRNWLDSKALVNGKEYSVSLDGNGTPYILVDASASNSYEAVLLSSQSEQWYGENPYSGVVLPCSQFESKTANTIASFPMYATYKKTNGRTLVFDDGFALLRLRLKGAAKIVSVRVESELGYNLAGKVATIPATGEYKVEKGAKFVALNCTNEGTYVTLDGAAYHDFYLMIAPGDYSKGLRVSVCDKEYKASFYDLKDVKLAQGEVYTLETEYAPSEDLLFYQGFDNCVWGGDVVRGSKGIGFSPTDKVIGSQSGLDRTGYEEALTEVTYNNPGSGYIQSNVWDDVTSDTVETSHQVSDSYLTSRHFEDYKYLFRVQEHPGYVAIGTASSSRGIFSSPLLLNMKAPGSYRAKMRFAMQANFNGQFSWSIVGGGRITAVKLNGKELTLTAKNCKYEKNTGFVILDNSDLNIAKNAADEKVWNTIEMDVVDVSDGSRIYVRDEVVTTGVHGIYVDYIEARKLSSWERKSSNLRVMLWNIQNGMWADQHNNYDNFVAWVKKWDPDVCVWCESETIYKDKTGSSTSTKYLPDGWKELCKRYGHSYAAVGGNRDNYPQTVTSKYPITTVLRITNTNVSNKPVSHGAGHFTITRSGKKIHIVTLHMWPQSYGFGVATADREASTAKNEGDLYRQFEMQYIIDQTVNNAKYANEEYWLLGGDTNSTSRLDNWYKGYASNSTKLLTHDVVLNQTDLKDVIGHRYPGLFMASTTGTGRIDIMYASPKMYGLLDNAMTIWDSWTSLTAKSTYYSSFMDPSDHLPLIMDFDLSK